MPVAPQSVTLYDIVKDLGFPAAVALLILFQLGPKMDAVIQSNATLSAQVSVMAASCASLH